MTGERSKAVPRLFSTASWVRWARGIATVGLFGVVLYRTDWSILLATLRQLSVTVVVTALTINVAAHIFLAMRWQLVSVSLRIAVPFPTTLRCYCMGLFYNLFLPSSIGGEAARGYYLYRATRRPQLAGASSIVDRWAGLAGLLIMAWAASLFLEPASELGSMRPWILLTVVVYVIFSLALMSRAVPRIRALGRTRLRALGRGRARLLSVALRSVGTSLRLVLRRPLLMFLTFALTLAYYVTLTFTHAMVAADLGRPAPFQLLAVYVPLVAVLSMAPITVNGIGLREILYAGLFASAGWPLEASLTLSWVVFASVLISGIPGLVLSVQFGDDGINLSQKTQASGGGHDAGPFRFEGGGASQE